MKVFGHIAYGCGEYVEYYDQVPTKLCRAEHKTCLQLEVLGYSYASVRSRRCFIWRYVLPPEEEKAPPDEGKALENE